MNEEKITAVAGISFGLYAMPVTLQPNGNVLFSGGLMYNGVVIQNAQIFNTTNNSVGFTGNLTTPRASHTTSLLPNGKIFIFGGSGSTSILATSEVFQ